MLFLTLPQALQGGKGRGWGGHGSGFIFLWIQPCSNEKENYLEPKKPSRWFK